MKTKTFIKFKIILLTAAFFMMSTPLVNAQDGSAEEIIDNVIENAREHNLREEELKEEIKGLTVNELEDIDEYLSNKHDITVSEEQVLTATQELLG